MITPELLSYIRGELAKGRTREEVRADLVKGGGWREEDLSEAFRIVIPMQGFFNPTAAKESAPVMNNTSPSVAKTSSKPLVLRALLVLVIAGLIFSVWFYRVPLKDAWASVMGNIKELPAMFGSKEETPEVKNNPVNTPPVAKSTENTITDCGVTGAPDLKNPLTYRDNSVLNCLGNNALSCGLAKATLNHSLFPTLVEITKAGDNACNFRLSYAADSTLVDGSGNKLAGQYIMCPVAAVKMVDESSKTLAFKEPTKNDPSKYGSQMYFYGTLGVFMEQNVDKSKILSLGCSGSYIDSVIASYKSQ
jgi:hypothetical protein